jgi:hypothetical protein
MNYYRQSGGTEYLPIILLARIHFSTMLNLRLLEEGFLTCKHIMGSEQIRLAMEHLEKKALLAQDADLIRQGII